MATLNPFDLLGDDDAEDPSQLIAAQKKAAAAASAAAAPKKGPAQAQSKPASQGQPIKPARLPSKPLPPSQAVREAKNESGRGGRGGGRGYGRGRGGSGFNRGFSNNEHSPAGQGAVEEGESGRTSERRGGYGGPRGPFRGGRRGEFSNGEVGDGERPRRPFERHSGTGRGSEIKREGAGRGNWGTDTDAFAPVTEEAVKETEKNLTDENPAVEEGAADGNKETAANEPEEKEPEDKEMTLEEYEKVLEEKRKALQTLKTEERKVDAKEFASMQQLSSKKGNDDIFIKLGSEKDRKKEAAEKEEKAKKAVGSSPDIAISMEGSVALFAILVMDIEAHTMLDWQLSVSINEFLKSVEGESYYSPGGRGRGRGRGSRGGFSGSYQSNVSAPSIQDPGHFPTLGGK
ncbi:Hyaluronan/mRNA-binding protein [Trema orientale]|uniref:Hyaluronan/mRNA-binding protein n=1 Tax=Trema orientale TaxID=63057 RepID=A0A2P5FPR4_TREOI|nr:Hyaluronan/mRNA-binding protein [Trema orientale]